MDLTRNKEPRKENHVDQDLLNELLEVGFLISSRLYGAYRTDSDWGIVYSIKDTPKIDRILFGRERIPSKYFSGYSVDMGIGIINMIPVHPMYYRPWLLATNAMQATLCHTKIKDPTTKYALFQGLVALYKATIPRDQNDNN
jgi:hypothetical protein